MKISHTELIVIAMLASGVAAHDDAGKTASGVRYHGGDESILQGFL